MTLDERAVRPTRRAKLDLSDPRWQRRAFGERSGAFESLRIG
jgi:hypothetical protein